MSAVDLKDVSTEDLVQANLELTKDRQQIRVQQLAINAELTRRAREQAMAKDVAALEQKHGVSVEVKE